MIETFLLVSNGILVVAIWFLLVEVKKIKDQQKVFSIISTVRNKKLFIQSFQFAEFIREEKETTEHFVDRCPEGGLFDRDVKAEKEIVRTLMQNTMKHKSVSEIDDLVSLFY